MWPSLFDIDNRAGNTRSPPHISESNVDHYFTPRWGLQDPKPTSLRKIETISKLYGIADSSLTYLSFSLTEEATPLSTKSWSASPLKFANSFVKDISERIATEASTLFASPRTDFDPDTQHEIRWLNTSYPVQALLIWSDLLFPLTTRLRYKDLLPRMTTTTLLCSRSHPHQSMLM